MKPKVSGDILRGWIKEIKILFRNPKFVGMLTVAIITVSLPITILTLNSNTDNRQHASSGSCNNSGKEVGITIPDLGVDDCLEGTNQASTNNTVFCNSDNTICYYASGSTVPQSQIDTSSNKTWKSDWGITIKTNSTIWSIGSGNPVHIHPWWTEDGKEFVRFNCLGNWCTGAYPYNGQYDPNNPPTDTNYPQLIFSPSGSGGGGTGGSGAKCIAAGGYCLGGGSFNYCPPGGTISQNYDCSIGCCIPPANPCSNVSCGNGLYCGGACGNTGDPNKLYDCENKQISGTPQVCSNGCQPNSSGQDACKSTSGGCGTQDVNNNECEYDTNNACGSTVAGHGLPALAHVTHDACGWKCQDDNSPCNDTISGHIYLDEGNGQKGDVTKIPHLTSIVVSAEFPGWTTFKTNVKSDGSYSITNLAGGKPNISLSGLPDGYSATKSQTISVDFTNRDPKDVDLGIAAAATPTDTPNPTPTDTPTPTDSPIPPDPSKTIGNITLKFQGIGPNDNPTPLHPNRQIILYFYPVSDTSFQQTPYVSPIGTVTYNQSTGYFANASFSLKGLSEGNYLVLVKSLDGSLMSQIGTGDGTGPITIVTTGGSNFLVDIQDPTDQNADTNVPLLKMGDIVTSGSSFNFVDPLDYSAFVDCYGQTPPALSDACFKHQGLIDTKTQVFLPDLNDDGKIDGTDYTMLEGNYGHFGVGGSTLNRGNDPTKN